MRPRARPVPPPPLRLLGIDPGTRNAGWGLVELRGADLRLVACGVLKAPARWPLGQRLRRLFAGFEALMAKYHPDAAALEAGFSGVNVRAAMSLGEGRGTALLALARAGLSVQEFSPAEVKKAVAGHGGASKGLVARMVCARLRLAQAPRPADITDALAVALALAHRQPRT